MNFNVGDIVEVTFEHDSIEPLNGLKMRARVLATLAIGRNSDPHCFYLDIPEIQVLYKDNDFVDAFINKDTSFYFNGGVLIHERTDSMWIDTDFSAIKV